MSDKHKLDGWNLIFLEEFENNEVDGSVWSRITRGSSDWNNTMSDDPRLVKIKNGILHLVGMENDNIEQNPSPYITGGLRSRGKYSFLYGKIQIKAKFKSAKGAWPALWMIGTEKPYPESGEIDLMEHLNFDDKVYQTIHSAYTLQIDKTNTPPKGGVAPIERNDWNTYGCEWDEQKLVFTVNGKTTHTYPRMPSKGEKQWPFNQPFFMILSMQIGGQWVGEAEPSHYPAQMEIDWIRIFKKTK